jgi:mono/diheme cytochrome c family protein
MRRIAVVAVSFLLPLLSCAKPTPRHDRSAGAEGAALYRVHCSSCHGSTGQGDGPSAVRLGVLPPDLTTLSRRNGGTYPFDEVMRLIGGRVPIRGHGGAEMPIWGDAFLEPEDGYDAAGARRKVRQLTQYLASVQIAEDK